MKKFIITLLSVVMCFACLTMATSCVNKKINKEVVGVYEMANVSGTINQNGFVTNLDVSLYEYYRITLKEDGSALVESKGTSSSAIYEAEGTWEWSDGKIKLKTTQSGITVTEVMDWADGVITYKAYQESAGIKIDMVLTLERVTDDEKAE